MQYQNGMPTSYADHIVKMHRVEQAKREHVWQAELDARRQVIASRACVDVEGLRQKLGV